MSNWYKVYRYISLHMGWLYQETDRPIPENLLSDLYELFPKIKKRIIKKWYKNILEL